MPSVIITRGKEKSTTAVPAKGAVIGRSLECEITIAHAGVSRKHCRLEPHEGGFRILDLGSTNGVRINGARMADRVLKEGDRVELGPEVSLVWTEKDAGEAERAAAKPEKGDAGAPKPRPRPEAVTVPSPPPKPAAPPPPPADASSFRLVRMEGEAFGEEYGLGSEPITIGRVPGNSIVITDDKASKEHCRIERDGDHYRVVDLGSKNGTRVNGTKIDAFLLTPGDLVSVGTTRFVFLAPVLDDVPAVSPSAPAAGGGWALRLAAAVVGIALAAGAVWYGSRVATRPVGPGRDGGKPETPGVRGARVELAAGDITVRVEPQGHFSASMGDVVVLEGAGLVDGGRDQGAARLEAWDYDGGVSRLLLAGVIGSPSGRCRYTQRAAKAGPRVGVAYTTEGGEPALRFRVPRGALRAQRDGVLAEWTPDGKSRRVREVGIVYRGRALFVELPALTACEALHVGEWVDVRIPVAATGKPWSISLCGYTEKEVAHMEALLARADAHEKKRQLGPAVAALREVAGNTGYRVVVLDRVDQVLDRLLGKAEQTINAELGRAQETLDYAGPEQAEQVARRLRGLAESFEGTEWGEDLARHAKTIETSTVKVRDGRRSAVYERLLVRGRGDIAAGRTELGRLFLAHVRDRAPKGSAVARRAGELLAGTK